MVSRDDTQSQQSRSAAPTHHAAELTELGRASRGGTHEELPPFASSELDAAADRYAAVVRRIAAENHVRKQTARRWFKEMLKFLDVCHAAEETVSPSPKVDKAWHAFLLFTRDYASYCDERFGCFIHHEPMDSSDPVAYQRAYLEAQLPYGELDPRVWPEPRSARRSRWGAGGPVGACVGAGDSAGCGGGGCGGGG